LVEEIIIRADFKKFPQSRKRIQALKICLENCGFKKGKTEEKIVLKLQKKIFP